MSKICLPTEEYANRLTLKIRDNSMVLRRFGGTVIQALVIDNVCVSQHWSLGDEVARHFDTFKH